MQTLFQTSHSPMPGVEVDHIESWRVRWTCTSCHGNHIEEAPTPTHRDALLRLLAHSRLCCDCARQSTQSPALQVDLFGGQR